MTVLIWPYRQKGHTLCVDDSLFTPFDRGLRHSVRALLRRGQRNVVLDLARVSWIDAAGVGELVRAYNMAAAVSGNVRITHATTRVREILQRVGLVALLETLESAESNAPCPQRGMGPSTTRRLSAPCPSSNATTISETC
jgi:anti-anti-sigma factor